MADLQFRMGLGKLEKTMRILVTGGAGFIGSHLVDRLIAEGHTVAIVDNMSTGLEKNINRNAAFYEKDIFKSDLTSIFKHFQFDIIFHLAGQINLRESLKNPIQDAEINIMGSLKLIELACKFKVKQFIFSSTGGAIYDQEAPQPWTTNSPCKPLSPYGLSKLTVERYLGIARNTHGLNSTILRYSNVYGPRQNAHGEAGVVAIFMNNRLANRPLKIFGDGEQTRDFIYVKDVVEANLIAMDSNLYGTFNVSTGVETSVNKVAEMISRLPCNGSNAIIHEPAIAGELKRTVLESNLPGLEARCFSDEGLIGTWMSFQS